jgi:AcrR family transcriptional regulator
VSDNEARDARETVLVAALACLEEVGYNRLRTLDVSKRSGLSEGTLFHYFPTKHLLVTAALDQALTRFLDRAIAQYLSLTPPYERRSLARILWQLLSEKQIGWTYELFAALKTDKELRRIAGPVLDASSRAIDDLSISIMQTLGGITDYEEARMAVDLTIWTMQGLVLRDMGQGSSGLEDDLIDFLIFAVHAVYPQENERSKDTSATTQHN